jgi:hypothetical protein
MADLQGIKFLKNALLSPLGSVRPFTSASPFPSITATSIVTRHDHHNIEVKTVSDLGSAPSIVETDIYLFAPKNFELGSIGKEELAADFRSRMRLSSPVIGEQGAAAFENALGDLKERVARFEAHLASDRTSVDISDPLCEEILDAIRELCSVVSGTLKHGASEHARQFFLSHSLLTTEDVCIGGLRLLASSVRSVHDMVARVRAASQSKHDAPAAMFATFDEFLSQLYVQYLGTIRSELDRIQKPETVKAATYAPERKALEEILNTFQSEEADYRTDNEISPFTDEESEIDRERRLLRLSQLKKFFQSKSFVDVTRQQGTKRVSESMAAAGTAVAAIIAAMLERFSRPEVGEAAVHGLFVIGAGVLFYVLRDRMKDRAKIHFQATAQKYLPDYEQQLLAQSKKIGKIKEWFRLRDSKSLPKGIIKLRHSAAAHEMEKRLPEDVLHCRRIQEVDASMLIAKGDTTGSRSLHENTRINVERYLKHMDDPFKELTELDASGRFRQARSHRVYHFYLCVKTISRPIPSLPHCPRQKRRRPPRRPHPLITFRLRVVSRRRLLGFDGFDLVEPEAAGGFVVEFVEHAVLDHDGIGVIGSDCVDESAHGAAV